MTQKNIDLALLRTLVLIVENGSFAAAAIKCERTQSAVSQQMQRLEKEFGVPLFEVVGRNKVLTDAGTWLWHHAEEMLRLNDNLFYEAEQSLIARANAHSSTTTVE